MILAGSALMVFNIIRYGLFVKKMNELEEQSRMRGLLVVPLLLLVFFLIGYIVVGLSGIATFMMASILLGGSIFVSIMLYVMYTIIKRMRDTDEMPVRNGIEATKTIRSLKNPALAGIPIIAVSARAFSEDIAAVRDAGMNGHIAKPIDMNQVVKTLSEILLQG